VRGLCVFWFLDVKGGLVKCIHKTYVNLEWFKRRGDLVNERLIRLIFVELGFL